MMKRKSEKELEIPGFSLNLVDAVSDGLGNLFH